MPALNYNKMFVERVQKGLGVISDPEIKPKRQTIRAMRKRPFKEGDKLMHYYGLRTKHCMKLGESVAKSVRAIYITLQPQLGPVLRIQVEGNMLSPKQIEKLAIDDGFKNAVQMAEYWYTTQSLPFQGQLIKW